MKRTIYIVTLLATALFGMAEETQERRKLPKVLAWAKAYMDSSTIKGIDRNYIEVPKKEWTVELLTTLNHASMSMDTQWEEEELNGEFEIRTHNELATAVGAAISYRSYTLSYAKMLTGSGSSFSLGTTSSNYAIHLSTKSYSSDRPEVMFKGTVNGEYFNEREKEQIGDPIRVRTLFIDGYYLFNGKHFSYLAAYTPSLIQRKSAGSVMVGAMYYHASIKYDSDNALEMTTLMQGTGKMKTTQVSVGAGYSYNWVPARGWLVNVTAMPMLTLYNRTKMYNYGLEYIGDDISEEDWDNFDSFRLRENGIYKTPNRVKLNFDARLSLVYNWNNTFLRAEGQYNRFSMGGDNSSGHLTDWTAYASVGIRF